MEPPTVTLADGTVIQLKWRNKSKKKVFELPKLIEMAKKEKVVSPKKENPKKTLTEKEYIDKCLIHIKKELELKKPVVFKFYQFKEIQLMSIKYSKISCHCDYGCDDCNNKNKNIYTLNLARMTPTKNSSIQIILSEKTNTRLKNIVSRIEINNKSFIV
jgi:hypothetical protein